MVLCMEIASKMSVVQTSEVLMKPDSGLWAFHGISQHDLFVILDRGHYLSLAYRQSWPRLRDVIIFLCRTRGGSDV